MTDLPDADAKSFPAEDHYDSYEDWQEEVEHWQRTHVHRSVDGHAIVKGDHFWNNDLRVVKILAVAPSAHKSGKYSDTGEIQTWHDTGHGSFDTLSGDLARIGRLVKYYNGHDAGRYPPGTSYSDVK